ncbi:MAG: hypothetical protein GTO02_03315 [Candidatus Dadabacteria bacterium]|nr:hypothetical protein [Candidatus Dadabacteria bacterium]NIQ13458.1 hypothetical protein [Candidatus Dadabacteria bacterium]
MRFFIFIFIALMVALPINSFSQPLTQSRVKIQPTDESGEEVYTYYDLRDRKTYIQVTNIDDEENPLCIHVQVFQQDKGCNEIDFEDELTPNDTVVYDMDNLVRNEGSAVPANLDDDSYGIVAISAFECGNRNASTDDPLIGNVRIIDDTGYEYRMNFVTANDERGLLEDSPDPESALGNIIVPFNTIDGAKFADVIGFILHEDKPISGINTNDNEDLVYNEEVGITFSVFQFDENEEPISCDQKTLGCGPNVVLNYGINEDYPASRGDNLLCEGAGLKSGQTNGFISLENATFLSPLPNEEQSTFGFVCLVGLNNGNGTGSMDECIYKCNEPPCPD